MQPVSQAYAESMKSPLRERGYIKINIGDDLEFTNDDVITASLDYYMSPTGEDLPQIDFTLVLNNVAGIYDIDNPTNPLTVIREGTPLNVMYGYDLPVENEGDVPVTEWVQGAYLAFASFDVNDSEATIHAVDFLRGLTTVIPGTTFTEGSATWILANEVAYYTTVPISADSALDGVRIHNPVPSVTIKEAIQMIANVTGGKIVLDRFGNIKVAAEGLPYVDFVRGGMEATYSRPESVVTDIEKIEYAARFAKDYITADGSMFFISQYALTADALSTGYVSEFLSDAYGRASGYIHIHLSKVSTWRNVTLVFGEGIAKNIRLTVLNDSTTLIDRDERNNTSKRWVLGDLEDFDDIRIIFLDTVKPYHPVVLQQIVADVDVEFEYEYNDMLSVPVVTQEALTSRIIVPFTTYIANSENEFEQIFLEPITQTEAGTLRAFIPVETPYETLEMYLDGVLLEPGWNCDWLIRSGQIAASFYNVSVGDHEIMIMGKPYSVQQGQVEVSVSADGFGQDIIWDNPMIDSAETALRIATKLADHYDGYITYTYDTRGNPELDIGDVITQENRNIPDMKVEVLQHTITFNSVFGGKVSTARNAR